MKTFTTSIFVPAKFPGQMNVMEKMETDRKFQNRALPINDDLGTGALDSLESEEEFILIVNGQYEKHHIRMKASTHCAGKTRLMVVEPEKEEVRRFIAWRIDQSKRMSQNQGAKLQLRNFSVEDMRRLIRTAYAGQERKHVNYR